MGIETCLEAEFHFNFKWLQEAISICSRSVHGLILLLPVWWQLLRRTSQSTYYQRKWTSQKKTSTQICGIRLFQKVFIRDGILYECEIMIYPDSYAFLITSINNILLTINVNQTFNILARWTYYDIYFSHKVSLTEGNFE